MPRPPQRDTAGRWSLRQVAAEAQITTRTITRVADLGWLDASNLGYRDIAVAKVAVALLDAPRSPGVARDDAPTVHAQRTSDALRLTRDLTLRGEPVADQWLIITATSATLGDPFAIGYAAKENSEPILLLPVGAWVSQAHAIAHAKQAAS